MVVENCGNLLMAGVLRKQRQYECGRMDGAKTVQRWYACFQEQRWSRSATSLRTGDGYSGVCHSVFFKLRFICAGEDKGKWG